MNYNYIGIPAELRKWINRQPGYDGISVRENTFTNQERWLLGRTDAQIWEYAKSDPFWTCPLFRGDSCSCDKKLCNKASKRRPDGCWETFTKWANTPIKKEKSQ
ncbi:hypothetical protein FACS1894202_09410 [Clostridia bacterium]|nr:hypothetical protein FACS1894202_09410 [Clostridia bacterium]